MSGFIYRGPLPPNSPLFRGRDAILQKLKIACEGVIQSYIIVYGGRQNGKTSLLLRLRAELPSTIRTCFVDFQGLPNAQTEAVIGHIAKQMALQLRVEFSPITKSSPELTSFFNDVCEHSEGNVVLIFEELGALPVETRNNLANVIRSVFTNRFDPQNIALGKLMVIFAGGIELYDLAASQVSTLHNVCELLYLNDLSELDVLNVLKNGFPSSILEKELNAISSAIYACVGGHPFFTQKLGALLAENPAKTLQFQAKTIRVLVDRLLQDDILLRHIAKSLREQNLLAACPDLLGGQVRFSRFDEEMARLELLGIAKEQNNKWVVRNLLFEQALDEWLSAKETKTRGATDAASSFNASTSIGGNMDGIIIAGNGNVIRISKDGDDNP